MKTREVLVPVRGGELTGHVPMEMSVQCLECLHLGASGPVCKAFPKGGIPIAIMQGRFDHALPYKGDGGVRFMLRTELIR